MSRMVTRFAPGVCEGIPVDSGPTCHRLPGRPITTVKSSYMLSQRAGGFERHGSTHRRLRRTFSSPKSGSMKLFTTVNASVPPPCQLLTLSRTFFLEKLIPLYFDMANLHTVGMGIAILAAVLSQLPTTQSIWNVLKLGLAIGKVLQPISDFPSYRCHRIHDPVLQACEDLWLSEPTRQLFLACSDSDARAKWMPKYVMACGSFQVCYDLKLTYWK